MIRTLLATLLALFLSERTLAVVESLDSTATLSSEKTANPFPLCTSASTAKSPERIVTPLEACGVSLERFEDSVPDNSFLRIYERASSPYGWSSITFNRRFPLPVSGFGRQDGVGISTSISLNPFGAATPFAGATSSSTSITLIERLQPTVRPDFGPATLKLGVVGGRPESFSEASVSIFDHDTNELLLSWDMMANPDTAGNGWYVQELNFDDRLGHAIRYEFQANGRSSQNPASFAAVAFLNVPEPESILPLHVLFAVALCLRTKEGRSPRRIFGAD